LDCRAGGLFKANDGSTCSGKALATACTRLGVSLVHARPYSMEAIFDKHGNRMFD